jgi:hypothetical protein
LARFVVVALMTLVFVFVFVLVLVMVVVIIVVVVVGGHWPLGLRGASPASRRGRRRSSGRRSGRWTTGLATRLLQEVLERGQCQPEDAQAQRTPAAEHPAAVPPLAPVFFLEPQLQ